MHFTMMAMLAPAFLQGIASAPTPAATTTNDAVTASAIDNADSKLLGISTGLNGLSNGCTGVGAYGSYGIGSGLGYGASLGVSGGLGVSSGLGVASGLGAATGLGSAAGVGVAAGLGAGLGAGGVILAADNTGATQTTDAQVSTVST